MSSSEFKTRSIDFVEARQMLQKNYDLDHPNSAKLLEIIKWLEVLYVAGVHSSVALRSYYSEHPAEREGERDG